MRNKLIVFVIALVILSVYGAAQEVPLNLQVKLMLKIISMDRNFTRFGDPIKIGVSSDEFLKELNAIKGKLTIKGKNFVAEKMASPDKVPDYRVIYMGTNWSRSYLTASAKAAESKCLVFCQAEEGVTKGGGAVSFKVVDGRPKIVVNVGNAKKQGTDFPAGFLKITVVVGGLR
ncbi:MAG: YfiR family protein [Candidatus Aminicenantes bacterium]|nr:MAG: YfiR family protein [Candidatus Aminicenantes bacterium]